MKYKIREPKRLIAIVLVAYIVLSLYFITNNFSNRTGIPREITGEATGTVKIFLGNATVEAEECSPPSVPILREVGDTKSTTVTLEWNSFRNSTQHDRLVFDSESVITANSPQTKNRLKRGEHTWKVRSCDVECCSKYATDTFKIIASYSSPTGTVVTETPTITKEEPSEIPKTSDVRTPSAVKVSAKDIAQNLIKMLYLMIAIGITIFAFTILLDKFNIIGKKSIRIVKLKEYVLGALKKGFSEDQIKIKLSSSNVADEEINNVFVEIKKSNDSIPKEK
ncbi:MAG: hypothetical protein AABW88_02970 [Nanoarchaeota archaeon]